jgi:biopolymer transport protein TolQ
VDVTAFSGGNVNINASVQVSGTVISGGNVDVSGDSITASFTHVRRQCGGLRHSERHHRGQDHRLVLFVLSLFSWTIIITKFRQLMIARKAAKKFFRRLQFHARPAGHPARGEEFDGRARLPTVHRGAEELAYHLKNNPVQARSGPVTGEGNTDHLARANTVKISMASFEAVKVVLEEAAAAEAMSLEKGMIVLSTAVAGGPFIGLLGTVWGVMSTFAGIAVAQQASLTAMAPGVAAAWWPPSPACWWPFPAMFGYNFMVTTIRHITQELDGLPAATPTRSNTPTWITATSRTRSRNALKRFPPVCCHEKVFAVRARIVDGTEHHAAAGPGVRVAGDLHHHDHPAGQGHGP